MNYGLTIENMREILNGDTIYRWEALNIWGFLGSLVIILQGEEMYTLLKCLQV